ncbi:hypothetical protein BH24ACT10_BH24ACT10_01270 [soil metagenome]
MTAAAARTTRGLGWTSLALGLPALLAPQATARFIGLRGDVQDTGALTMVGAQELLAAGGLLTGTAPRFFLWSRVAGDVAHLAALRQAMAGGGGDGRTRAATAAVAGITAVDLVAALRSRRPPGAATELTAGVTVNKTPQEVYDFWRGLERLPRFMQHVESVEWLDERTTRWRAKAPVGKVGWDAVLEDDVRGERISWRSLPGATVPNEGSVDLRTAPGGRGTEVRVHLAYSVPGGRVGRGFARLLGEEPHQQVEDDLRRFKQVMETGEVVRSDGSPEGHNAARQLVQRPAQPVR